MANNYYVTPQEMQEIEEKKKKQQTQKAVTSVKGATGDTVANWSKHEKTEPKGAPYRQAQQQRSYCLASDHTITLFYRLDAIRPCFLSSILKKLQKFHKYPFSFIVSVYHICAKKNIPRAKEALCAPKIYAGA